MITIKEFYGDVKDIDESVLAVKSDCLWAVSYTHLTLSTSQQV